METSGCLSQIWFIHRKSFGSWRFTSSKTGKQGWVGSSVKPSAKSRPSFLFDSVVNPHLREFVVSISPLHQYCSDISVWTKRIVTLDVFKVLKEIICIPFNLNDKRRKTAKTEISTWVNITKWAVNEVLLFQPPL